MRRLLPALLAAVALGGCGEDPESPLDSVLGFFGEKAPFVAVVDTDSGGDQQSAVREIAKRFPFGPQLLGQLQDAELRLLLGNPAAFGATDARALGDQRQMNVAVEPRDPSKVEEPRRRQVERRRQTNAGKESGGLGGLFGPSLFLGPLGPFEASVRAEPNAPSGGFVQRFD